MKKKLLMTLVLVIAVSMILLGIGLSIDTDMPHLSSHMALAYDLDENAYIYKKHVKEQVYPASITKVLTIYTAMKHMNSLDDRVAINQSDIAKAKKRGASVIGLRSGEVCTYRDLIEMALFQSAADATYALSRGVFGDEATCVAAMNEEAAALGMTASHFMNVIGLHDEDLYTTGDDLVKLMRGVYHDDAFMTLFTTLSYTATNGNFQIENLAQRYNDCLGMKTGFTNKAEYTQAAIFQRGKHHVVIITTGAKTAGKRRKDVVNIARYVWQSYNPAIRLIKKIKKSS